MYRTLRGGAPAANATTRPFWLAIACDAEWPPCNRCSISPVGSDTRRAVVLARSFSRTLVRTAQRGATTAIFGEGHGSPSAQDILGFGSMVVARNPTTINASAIANTVIAGANRPNARGHFRNASRRPHSGQRASASAHVGCPDAAPRICGSTSSCRHRRQYTLPTKRPADLLRFNDRSNRIVQMTPVVTMAVGA